MKKRRWYRWFFLSSFFSISIGILFLFLSFFLLIRSFQLSPLLVWQELRQPTLQSTGGRTNILFLGVGGGDHEGPDLTDTMIIVSLSQNGGQPIVLSLPRDFWSETMKDKINTAYHYGNVQQRPGGGIGFTKEIVKEMTGVDIHYTVLIDFAVFTTIINSLEGIDVIIPKGFTDTEYPIAGKENDTCTGDPVYRCRYQTVTFLTGIEHMSGERALIYVRSRHAEGVEGSDFARGKRQQEVVSSLMKTMMDPFLWVQKNRLETTLSLVTHHITTDMGQKEFVLLGVIGWRSWMIPPLHLGLESELVNPPESLYGGRYVLVPKISLDALKRSIEASLGGTIQQHP